MSLSLSEVIMATIIAFDRYIVTIAPKWGKWRCHYNYLKLIIGTTVPTILWSLVPITDYGRYSTFHENTFCSLDWRQGNFDVNTPEALEAAHHYIAFLTATCLIFFLIPVCIASSFYYSIIDHVDRLSSTEIPKENEASVIDCYSWAPEGNVSKIGLGCLLVSTLPFLAYSIVCLNPMKSDFNNISYVVVPVIISRMSPLLNPLLYIWCNPRIVPIHKFITKQIAKRRRPPPPKTYHTINLIAEVSGMSFPILTPAVPRRQLPKIPPNLMVMSKNQGYYDETHEAEPILH